jgi:hypothetical protein
MSCRSNIDTDMLPDNEQLPVDVIQHCDVQPFPFRLSFVSGSNDVDFVRNNRKFFIFLLVSFDTEYIFVLKAERIFLSL